MEGCCPRGASVDVLQHIAATEVVPVCKAVHEYRRDVPNIPEPLSSPLRVSHAIRTAVEPERKQGEAHRYETNAGHPACVGVWLLIGSICFVISSIVGAPTL